ncbi:MAG TPA: DNA polymerase I [Saprospiraceae bacterium]|jgi:DNA polymerase-1|nr:DNA polymerase I [Saprospiraceae bacterium]MCC6689694.1 DNA polymerase I [Saprospiraceae bacterium]HMV22869.1 DNA polymerase I [Saprospiraceae bacterium]HMX84435.1 DNA polymerase I [Saprospiraceae bacterium]HMZ73042.1 DNA polymerase I [Saprospiraceae bacterium]
MSEKILYLLDGHALVYRAHYAFISRPLINSKGQNVSAVSGFMRTVWDLIKNRKPTHIAAAFDLYSDTFRHKMYEPYKANRDAQPEDITYAVPKVIDILKAMNIPIMAVENYEADDVIGTIAKQAARQGYTVFMVTPDKDYGQLVEENIKMYKPGRQGNEVEILGVEEITQNWGIQRPEQVIDILGLMGDSVDNIPGLPGIGEKTASKLIQEFGSVENLIQNTDKLKGKQKEIVENYAAQGMLSKQLATIELNVPIQFDEKEYEISEFDKDKLSELFKELEFRTLAREILGQNETSAGTPGVQADLFGNTVATVAKEEPETKPEYTIASNNISNTTHHYTLCDDDALINMLVSKLSMQKSFSFDTETTGIDPNEAELVGMSFSFAAHEGYYVPVPANKSDALKRIEHFRPVLENPNIEKIGQNIKYDFLIMKWHGINIRGPIFDTMIAHYVCEPEMRHKLDYLAEAYLNYKMVPIEDLIGKGVKQLNMRDVDPQQVSDYAAEDADIAWQLKDEMIALMKKNATSNIYHDIEVPLIQVLAEMEYEGVKIDRQLLYDYSKVLEKQILEKESEIYKQAGSRFNIASPKQVGEILFDRMKIPYRWKKTASGQYSTDEEKLTELSYEFDFVNTILEHRKLSKLKSTYVDALPNMINPKTGRIHSSFNQARTATGRLSSENPNLQNIPIRDEAGRHIRKAFIPRDENHLLISADYSQIELRLIAEMAGEQAMLEAFQANQDIHAATAAKVYGVPLHEVTSDQRRNAKTVNFSIIYGAGATNLSQQLKIKRAEAKELIDQYFNQYKDLKAYMDNTVEFARKNGYVTTLLGRRRYLRDIDSRNSLARSNAERMAINSPVQGSAADMIKIAMINIQKALSESNFKTKMILQVHDELVFDVPVSEADKVSELIRNKMIHAIPSLKVPIEVGIGRGQNWLEAH